MKISKIKTTLQVSAGYQYALILKQDGSLYGIGNNCSAQINDSNQKQITQPLRMATHIKAFAAGCNYSIYITENGDVKLAGNGKYAEKFLGFKNAQDVHAFPNENIFLIEDAHGIWFAFGDNKDGNITASKTECLYQFPEEPYKGPICNMYGTEGPNKILQNGGSYHVHSVCSHEKYKEVARTDIFRTLSQIYGEENLSIELNEIGEGTCQYENGLGGHYSFFHSTTYAPRIIRKTLAIYNPIKCDYENMVHSDENISENAFANATKTVTVGIYTFILKSNNELTVLDQDSQKETFLSDNVYDISMTENVVIISKLNGELLFGAEEHISLFYGNWDMGLLNSYVIS